MQLKSDRIFNSHFIANSPENVPVKEFRKWVNIWWRYGQWQSGAFLGHRRRWASGSSR